MTRGPAQASGETTRFIEAVRDAGFTGEVSVDAANRTVFATDNSVYQSPPDAILFPRSQADLALIARVLWNGGFEGVCLRPRGGGTSTSAASLGPGVSVDLSRLMNRILEINVEEGWARVEAGVVKDQLNDALAPHGLFFAPECSTSSRATLGGMIATDACGQGSVLYGKTSNHVLELEIVLADGSAWTSKPLAADVLSTVGGRNDLVGEIHRAVDRVQRENAVLIERRFPKLNRSLTGYDLAHLRDEHGRFNLNSVLCGSEGTLAFVAAAKLRVLPKPRASVLVAVRYRAFEEALRDAQALMRFGPASIETVDELVLDLARSDNIWRDVAAYFPEDPDDPLRGINLVEFVGNDRLEVEASVRTMTRTFDDGGRLGYCEVTGAGIARVWEMRKRAVGLLGKIEGRAQPIAFIEDSCVPPEKLADFVAELRELLDRNGLAYGMYGHVDAGVLHVRPAIDLTDPAQEHLIRDLSEATIGLCEKYGGLIWGEHGKGVRSEFVPEVFGPLYPCLVEVKAAFDPHETFNPGKIASARGDLLKVDSLPLRGQFDRGLSDAVRAEYNGVLHCNGNGACFNYDEDDPMCPSWKATRERRHSPKGRAMLIREWLRLLAADGVDPVAEARRIRGRSMWGGLVRRLLARRSEADFSHEVKEAMDGCLACNACAGQCPVKVSIPSFRARFLELYHGRYSRRTRDYAVGGLESLLPLIARAPSFTNAVVSGSIGRAVAGRLGMVDLPLLSGVDLGRELERRGVAWARPEVLASLQGEARRKSVVIVQDAFTSYFETGLLLDVVDMLLALGFRPFVAPYRPAGTPLHVLGFLGAFERVVLRNARDLQHLARSGIELVGIDPAMTLPFRSAYREVVGADAPNVRLLQEFLSSRIEALPELAFSGTARLLPHCTERAMVPASLKGWTSVFKRLGLDLEIVAVGCCGMAGNYGHETEHHALSRQIYGQSWRRHVEEDRSVLMATGFSCRAQAERFGGVTLPHPVRVLLDLVRAHRVAPERVLASIS